MFITFRFTQLSIEIKYLKQKLSNAGFITKLFKSTYFPNLSEEMFNKIILEINNFFN